MDFDVEQYLVEISYLNPLRGKSIDILKIHELEPYILITGEVKRDKGKHDSIT